MKRNRIDIRCAAWTLLALAFGLLLCFCSAPRQAYAAKVSVSSETKSTPLLFIVVGFAGDESREATPYDNDYDWHDAIFGSDNSLSSYYLDMSEGSFTFSPVQETCAHGKKNANVADRENDGIVHITLDEPHGDWGLVNDDSDIAFAFSKVVLDIFHKAAQYVDYASLDHNGDKTISTNELAVCVCIAGYDASPFDNPGRTDVPSIWPHSGIISHSDESSGQFHLDSYIAIAERLWHETDPADKARQEPMGVLYHELGHHLGLPDLYPTNSDREGNTWSAYRVNMLSLMDKGGWAESPDGNSGQSTPTAFDAWSRYALRWEFPEIVTHSGDYTVSSQDSDSGYRTLLIPTSNPDQYFLVENRQVEGHDSALSNPDNPSAASGGVVIWHIDKEAFRQYAYDNKLNGTDHAPGVMPLFFENNGIPDTKAAFFCEESFHANTDNGQAVVNLLLYDDMKSGTPSTRVNSGITVECDCPSNRDMTVHIEFDNSNAGTSGNPYPIDDDDPARSHLGGSALGRIACSAILDETNADIALVDEAAIRAGLPKGTISFEQAESVLDPQARIECYNLTGSQIIQLIEQSYMNATLDNATAFLGLDTRESHAPILNFAGISYSISSDENGIAHVSSASIGGDKLEKNRTYYVATVLASNAARASFSELAPNVLVLWGCPADAIRSFVQKKKWESRAAKLTSNQTVEHAPREAEQTVQAPAQKPLEHNWFIEPIALGALAACFIFGGAVFTVAIRRS